MWSASAQTGKKKSAQGLWRAAHCLKEGRVLILSPAPALPHSPDLCFCVAWVSLTKAVSLRMKCHSLCHRQSTLQAGCDAWSFAWCSRMKGATHVLCIVDINPESFFFSSTTNCRCTRVHIAYSSDRLAKRQSRPFHWLFLVQNQVWN